MIDTGLEGKVALVTGANNPLGIGAATARALSREGAKVFLTYLRTQPEPSIVSKSGGNIALEPDLPLYHEMRMQDASRVIKEINESDGTAAGEEMDLTDTGCIPTLFDSVEDRFGRVEILINNAAHYDQAGDTILEISKSIIDDTFNVNVRASLLLTREFAQRCRASAQGWGRVVNLSTGPANVSKGRSRTERAKPLWSPSRAVLRMNWGLKVSPLTLLRLVPRKPDILPLPSSKQSGIGFPWGEWADRRTSLTLLSSCAHIKHPG